MKALLVKLQLQKGFPAVVVLYNILPIFFRFQRLMGIHQEVRHIPGHKNDTADALSRFKPHALPLEHQCPANWQCFFERFGLLAQLADFDIQRSLAVAKCKIKYNIMNPYDMRTRF